VLTEEPDRHHGKIYTPTGPQSISFAEGAEQLRQVLGREVRYVPVADEAARTNLLETGMPEWIVELQVEYGQAYASGWGDFTTSDFQDVVGRRPRSFADFARDYAGVFTPAEAVNGAAER